MAKISVRNKKRLSKCHRGEKSLTLKHSYNNTFSVFRSTEEKRPLISVTANGEYKISVIRLVLILLCTLSALAVAVKIAKTMRDRRLAHASMMKFDGYDGYGDEDLPF